MLKLGAETEITWGLSSVSKILAAKSNSIGLRCLYHTKIVSMYLYNLSDITVPIR